MKYFILQEFHETPRFEMEIFMSTSFREFTFCLRNFTLNECLIKFDKEYLKQDRLNSK